MSDGKVSPNATLVARQIMTKTFKAMPPSNPNVSDCPTEISFYPSHPDVTLNNALAGMNATDNVAIRLDFRRPYNRLIVGSSGFSVTHPSEDSTTAGSTGQTTLSIPFEAIRMFRTNDGDKDIVFTFKDGQLSTSTISLNHSTEQSKGSIKK